MSLIGPFRTTTPEVVTIDGDWRPAFRFTDRDGAVIDLTASGVDAWVDLKKSDGSGSTITRKISVSNQTAWVDDGTDGEVEFIFLAADIAALTADYNFDVWFVKSASSVKRKVYEGRVRFDAERA
jgi:hypothetical protein